MQEREELWQDLMKLTVFIQEKSLGTTRGNSLFSGYWIQEDVEMWNTWQARQKIIRNNYSAGDLSIQRRYQTDISCVCQQFSSSGARDLLPGDPLPLSSSSETPDGFIIRIICSLITAQEHILRSSYCKYFKFTKGKGSKINIFGESFKTPHQTGIHCLNVPCCFFACWQ